MKLIYVGILCCISHFLFGMDLQVELNKGKNLYLESGKTYHIKKTLAMTTKGQKILTRDVVTNDLSTYATLRLAPVPFQNISGKNKYNWMSFETGRG